MNAKRRSVWSTPVSEIVGYVLGAVLLGPLFSLPLIVATLIYRRCRERGHGGIIFAPWILAAGVVALNWVVRHQAAQSGGFLIDKLDAIRVAIGAAGSDAFVWWWTGLPKLLLGEAPAWWQQVLVAYGQFAVSAFVLSTVFGAPLFVLWGKRAARRTRNADVGGASHGTAHWGTVRDAKNAGALRPRGEGRGLMLGRFDRALGVDPRYRVRKHVLTCAPTRSGKGVGCVIPNLLEYPGSVFCLDIKGENCAVTSEQRVRMGQNVCVLDPFAAVTRKSHRINWLDWIDVSSPECVSDSAMLADTLVVRSGQGDDIYWDDAAASLIQGLLLYIAGLKESERHAGTLRHLLTLPERKLMALLEELSEDRQAAFEIIARAASAFVGLRRHRG